MDRIYALYTAFTDEMYRFATSHTLEGLRRGRGYGARLDEPAVELVCAAAAE